VIIGQDIAFGRIDDDGTQAFKRLSLLVGRFIAKYFFSSSGTFWPQCLQPERSLPQATLFPASARGLEWPLAGNLGGMPANTGRRER
jgi:hypothetical protein